MIENPYNNLMESQNQALKSSLGVAFLQSTHASPDALWKRDPAGNTAKLFSQEPELPARSNVSKKEIRTSLNVNSGSKRKVLSISLCFRSRQSNLISASVHWKARVIESDLNLWLCVGKLSPVLRDARISGMCDYGGVWMSYQHEAIPQGFKYLKLFEIFKP